MHQDIPPEATLRSSLQLPERSGTARGMIYTPRTNAATPTIFGPWPSPHGQHAPTKLPLRGMLGFRALDCGPRRFNRSNRNASSLFAPTCDLLCQIGSYSTHSYRCISGRCQPVRQCTYPHLDTSVETRTAFRVQLKATRLRGSRQAHWLDHASRSSSGSNFRHTLYGGQTHASDSARI